MVRPAHRHDRPLSIFVMADHLGHPHGRVHGGTTYFVNTLPAMRDAGHHLTVVFLGPRHDAAARLEQRGIDAHFLGMRKWDVRAAFACQRLLDAAWHDAVHLHSFKSHLLGRLAAHRRGMPAIVHVHDQTPMPPPLKLIQRRLGPATAALVGITEPVTEFARRAYAVPSGRCHTVLHGLDLTPFLGTPRDVRDTLRRDLGTAPAAPVIGMVGRVTAGKGQRELLEAMPRVLARVPDAELWIVGDGPDRQACERIARRLRLGPAVRFLGQRSDMPAILAAVDCVAMPSTLEEGFGFVAVEAMAAERPVIAFRTGGIAAAVRHEQTGILVPPANMAMFVDALVRCLLDNAWRVRIGTQGRVHASTLTLERHVQSMTRIFEQAIGARGGMSSTRGAEVHEVDDSARV
ncbi:MAG: glycosyltransferase family 4 protein [Phycisphaeraceae bacterium]